MRGGTRTRVDATGPALPAGTDTQRRPVPSEGAYTYEEHCQREPERIVPSGSLPRQS